MRLFKHFSRRQILAAAAAVLMATSVIVAPAAASLHALGHIENDAAAESPGDEPRGDAAPDTNCGLCQALSNGRAALEPPAPVLCLDLVLFKRLDPIAAAPLHAPAPAESESPRAPPLR